MPAVVLINPNDPMLDFEHMMQHRQYFAVMGNHAVQGNLNQFSVLPYVLDPSQDKDKAAWSWNQRHQQAHDDFNLDLPGNYNDGFSTIETVTPPTIHATGNSTNTENLTLSAVTGGSILIGSDVAGAGVPAGTKLIAQVSGVAGGAGVYTTNHPTTLTNVALTITHPPYQRANNTVGESFGIHQPGILIEGEGNDPETRTWWTFLNHQHHFTANQAILPLPTTTPITAVPPPAQPASNPWWWASRGPVVFPFW